MSAISKDEMFLEMMKDRLETLNLGIPVELVDDYPYSQPYEHPDGKLSIYVAAESNSPNSNTIMNIRDDGNITFNVIIFARSLKGSKGLYMLAEKVKEKVKTFPIDPLRVGYLGKNVLAWDKMTKSWTQEVMFRIPSIVFAGIKEVEIES